MKRIIGLSAAGLCLGWGFTLGAAFAAADSICADTITGQLCVEGTDCECNTSNGNCKRWIEPYNPYLFKEGDGYQVETQNALCWRKWRCLNISPTGGCTDDSQCVKNNTDPNLLVEIGYTSEYYFPEPPTPCF